MKASRIILSLVLPAVVLAACASGPKGAEAPIVIFYDNDVHCAIDGYPVAAALRDSEAVNNPNVLLVSAGDFLQGGSIGAASKGASIVELMNAVGYDYATLGNHEFDYGMDRLAQLSAEMKTKVLCCNLYDLRREDGKTMYEPFEIRSFGDVDVAFIGISTPYSFVSSNPTYFQDEKGEYVYSLCSENFYPKVQETIDAARDAGAEFVIAIGHLGDNTEDPVNALTLIASTTGLDAFIDGHAHSTVPGHFVKDKSGRKVLHTSTGSHFNNVGRMTIAPSGRISSKLIEIDAAAPRSAKVDSVVVRIKDEYKKQGARLIGESRVEFIYADDENPRLVRYKETGLGNFCADAFRYGLGAEIAVLGGGGIRTPIHKGPVTYDDIFRMFPFGNIVCTADVPGSVLVDALEYGVWQLPVDFGGFLQVSGLKFVVDVRVDSPVMVDDHKAFAGFNGPQRRISGVEVEQADGSYAPIDPERVYKVAGTTYHLKECGDGYTLFKDVKVHDTGMLDVQFLEEYISEHLGGVIPERYAAPEGRITKINRD